MSDGSEASIQNRTDRNYQLLVQVHAILGRASGFDEVLGPVADSLRHMLAVDGAMIVVVPPGQEAPSNSAVQFVDERITAELYAMPSLMDLEVVRQVFHTGLPLLVADYGHSAFALTPNDPLITAQVCHVAAVPIAGMHHILGVLLVARQATSPLNQPLNLIDQQVIEVIAGAIALWIDNQNTRLDLHAAAKRVAHFNLAKDRVIQRFSHELKTPLAVLMASLKLVRNRLVPKTDAHWQQVLARAQRNLERLLNMEYELEDILRERDEDHPIIS